MKSRSLIAEPFTNIINSQSKMSAKKNQQHKCELVCVCEQWDEAQFYRWMEAKCFGKFLFTLFVRRVSNVSKWLSHFMHILWQVFQTNFHIWCISSILSMEYQIKKMNWVLNSSWKIETCANSRQPNDCSGNNGVHSVSSLHACIYICIFVIFRKTKRAKADILEQVINNIIIVTSPSNKILYLALLKKLGIDKFTHNKILMLKVAIHTASCNYCKNSWH